MTSRADAARQTGERILAAALDHFAAAYYDEVTLDAIAVDAGVSVQTVIRRFGSKEGIVRALVQVSRPRTESQRAEAPVGDIRGAVANLVEHYESEGDLILHVLRQELRVPAYAEVSAHGRRVHAEWIGRVFAPWLDAERGVDRRRMLAQLVAVCDLYTWFLLRRQQGLSQRQTELALVELLEGVLP
ncbi:TetR/AcrR family transcriptional regulator [Nocardioides gansuensis]|nr:TetR/AcrR family transcriptional regulator [Nocardioides gansuensis]